MNKPGIGVSMRAIIPLLLLLTFISTGISFAQDLEDNNLSQLDSTKLIISQDNTREQKSSDPKKWHYQFIPAAWFPTMSTKIEIGSRTLQSTIKPRDILKDIDMSYAGRIEANNRDWGLFADFYNLRASQNITANIGTLGRSELRNTILQCAAFKRWYSADEKNHYDLLAGFRYYALSLEIDLADPLPTLKKDPNWIDPIIGGRANFKLSKNLNFDLYGDIGGFGAGSEFTWRASGIFDWQLSEGFSLDAGYNAFAYKYDKGGRFDKIKTDMQMYGPTLGLNFKF